MISPHRYTQHAKEEIIGSVSNEAADMVLARFHLEPELAACIVHNMIPNGIPAKYVKRMHSILITSFVNAVCKNATYKFTMAQKHKMLQKALIYTGNVRES